MSGEDDDDDTTGGGVVISMERPGTPVSPDSGEELVLASIRAASPTTTGDLPAVLMDYRMRRRRMHVELDARERRHRRILRFLVPLALVVSVLVVANLPLFDADEVVVEGVTQTPPGAVQWASHVDPGDPLLTLDPAAAERRIEALPWIDEATIEREWPSTVRITVTERVPVAALLAGEGVPPALVDVDGRVLDIVDFTPPGTIELTGLEAELAEGRRVAATARPALQLAAALSQRLPGVAVGVNLELDVSLAVGGIARFGNDENLDAKLLALETFLADVDTDNLAVLDLRVPSNITATRG